MNMETKITSLIKVKSFLDNHTVVGLKTFNKNSMKMITLSTHVGKTDPTVYCMVRSFLKDNDWEELLLQEMGENQYYLTKI